MTVHVHVPDVGAADPERDTSPIVDEDVEESVAAPSGGPRFCTFNDVRFPVGEFVRSGSEVLHCEERGVWVRVGEARPDQGIV